MSNKTSLSLREWDHMRTCHTCQTLWPMFMNYEIEHNQTSLQEVCTKWTNMTEKERESLLPQLKRLVNNSAKNIMYHRSSSPYHIFLSSKMRGVEGTFASRIKMLSQEWAAMSTEEKSEYVATSAEKKKQRLRILHHLNTHQKRALKLGKKLYKLKQKQKKTLLNRPRKPINKFMLYLNDRWYDEKKKETPASYQEIMRSAAYDWKNVLHPSEREQYKQRADLLRADYLSEKEQQQS